MLHASFADQLSRNYTSRNICALLHTDVLQSALTHSALHLICDINRCRGASQAPSQHTMGQWWCAPVQHDVRLRLVDCIVHPSPRLLHSQIAPFRLHAPTLRASASRVCICIHLLARLHLEALESLPPVCRKRLTSDSSLFFGSSLTMSEGSTTCLHANSRS